MNMKWINEARRAKGWTQEEMAKKLNISKSGYKKLEYGTNKLTLARFIQICSVLNLDAAATIQEVQKYENY